MIFAFMQDAVLHNAKRGEWLVKLHNEKVLEVLGHTTTIAARPAIYEAFLRINAYNRSLVKGIDDNIGLVGLGEGETQDGGTLGGCHLGGHIIVGKINLIIVRCSHLGLVREPAGTSILVKHGLTHCGHQRELAIIVDPWAGLVSLLEAADAMRSVGVLPSVTILAGLRHPVVHAPWHADDRVGVPRR